MVFRSSHKAEMERKPGGPFGRSHLQENPRQIAFLSGTDSQLKTVAGGVSFADSSGN